MAEVSRERSPTMSLMRRAPSDMSSSTFWRSRATKGRSFLADMRVSASSSSGERGRPSDSSPATFAKNSQ